MNITAEDYVVAFRTGVLPDGTKLERKAECSQIAEELRRLKRPISVSTKTKYFVLNYINSRPYSRSRCVEIGIAAYKADDIVTNPTPVGEEPDRAKCNSWASEVCSRLSKLGLLTKIKVKDKAKVRSRGAKKEYVYYTLTEEGQRWLTEYNVQKI